MNEAEMKIERKKAYCIGETRFEIAITMPSFPTENTKYQINNKLESGGGSAANAAVLLAKWGIDSYFAGIVGYDTFGTKIKSEFKNNNVRMDYLETDYENSTTTVFNIINAAASSSTLFNIATNYPQLKKLKLDFTPDIILMDGHDYAISKEAINRFINTPNVITLLDAKMATPQVLDLCKMVKYIVCNQPFAEIVTGKKIDFANPSTLANLYLDLKSRYKNANIIVTLGDKGALYAIENSIKILPAIKVETKDTTGAADIFKGTLAYALINNYDLEKAITIANIAAGLSTKTLGTRLSIPSLDEVIQYYETHK